MKKIVLILVLGICQTVLGSSDQDPTEPSLLMKCSFVESMSVSFGYRSIYIISGNISVLDPEADEAFFEVKDPVQVSIDRSSSTNFPGKHVGDTTATMNNHPWGNKVMIDVASTDSKSKLAFRIFVFPEASAKASFFSAYKIDSLSGNGLAGSCTYVEPRLVVAE